MYTHIKPDNAKSPQHRPPRAIRCSVHPPARGPHLCERVHKRLRPGELRGLPEGERPAARRPGGPWSDTFIPRRGRTAGRPFRHRGPRGGPRHRRYLAVRAECVAGSKLVGYSGYIGAFVLNLRLHCKMQSIALRGHLPHSHAHTPKPIWRLRLRVDVRRHRSVALNTQPIEIPS